MALQYVPGPTNTSWQSKMLIFLDFSNTNKFSTGKCVKLPFRTAINNTFSRWAVGWGCGRSRFDEINHGPQIAYSSARNYASGHPNAFVMGTEPAALPLPRGNFPNCFFARCDFPNEETDFVRFPFDFIRGSRLEGRVKNWSWFLSRAWSSLKPGGFIELHDISRDHTVPADHAWAGVPRLFVTCGQRLERSFGLTASGHLRVLMKTAGFVNITESWKRIPIEASDNMGLGILATLCDEIDALVRIAMRDSFNETAHEAYMEGLKNSCDSLTLTW